jgi:hypothetical protein
LDRAVTLRKLEALRHCLQRLRERRPATAALLARMGSGLAFCQVLEAEGKD